jgi:hypothetical protein
VATIELTRRNLFQPLVAAAPPPPKVEAPPPPPPAPKIPLSQRAAHLRLTGIIAGTPPQAVVEDRRRNATRYVSAGESIDEFHVEKVLPDRIVISADGDTLELAL